MNANHFFILLMLYVRANIFLVLIGRLLGGTKTKQRVNGNLSNSQYNFIYLLYLANHQHNDLHCCQRYRQQQLQVFTQMILAWIFTFP